ncbi:MAG: precorrin-2 C(20)-methyltransferase [Chloroflexota bacterium]
MELTAVGLGPGDPELVTLKGLRAIQEAELIFVPQSKKNERSRAWRAALPHIDESWQKVVVLSLPMTRNSDELHSAWRGAADVIFQTFLDTNCEKGVYLLLGDPLLYGTFIYIWDKLSIQYPQIDVNIIPGVTSFATAATMAGIPLATTSDRVAILPASYETNQETLARLFADFETVILMKAGPVLPELIYALDEMNLLDNTIYAERIGMPGERVITDLHELPVPVEATNYLSLLIVRQNEDKEQA